MPKDYKVKPAPLVFSEHQWKPEGNNRRCTVCGFIAGTHREFGATCPGLRVYERGLVPDGLRTWVDLLRANLIPGEVKALTPLADAPDGYARLYALDEARPTKAPGVQDVYLLITKADGGDDYAYSILSHEIHRTMTSAKFGAREMQWTLAKWEETEPRERWELDLPDDDVRDEMTGWIIRHFKVAAERMPARVFVVIEHRTDDAMSFHSVYASPDDAQVAIDREQPSAATWVRDDYTNARAWVKKLLPGEVADNEAAIASYEIVERQVLDVRRKERRTPRKKETS